MITKKELFEIISCEPVNNVEEFYFIERRGWLVDLMGSHIQDCKYIKDMFRKDNKIVGPNGLRGPLVLKRDSGPCS